MDEGSLLIKCNAVKRIQQPFEYMHANELLLWIEFQRAI
jgi:hypothetical protein